MTFSGSGSSASSNIYTPADGLTSQSASTLTAFSTVQSGARDSGGSSATSVSGDPFTSSTGSAVVQAIDNAPNGYATSTFDLGGSGLTSFTLSGNSTLTITAQVIESWSSDANTLDADTQFAFHLQDAQLNCQATSCADLDHGLNTAGDPASGFIIDDITMTFTNASVDAVHGFWFAGGSAYAQSLTSTVPVPEPAHIALTLLGLAALGALARRRKS